MALTQIEALLRERLGFDIETIGSKAVATMIKRAMEMDGFVDPAAYVRVLRHESKAWDRFVDQIVVPETWFFRDVAPFEFAADLIRAHFHSGSDRVIRFLSCPCATGEEPYSLVLSLLHAGAPSDSFLVDAVDVSRRALENARAGVFNARSFRGDPLPDWETYFDRSDSDGSRSLKATAKACVTFRQGNMIHPDFLTEAEPYDVVFCRNLLIYLHSEGRLLAMTALRRLVAEKGTLVLGHAEAAFAREHGFRPTGPAGAFAFAKSSVGPERKKRRIESPISRPSATPRSAVPIVRPAPLAELAPDDRSVANEEFALSLLAKASQLGDAGQLHSALRVCSEYLQQVPDSPEGHFLHGVLHDALGYRDLAASSFRKVLYLDPNHHEALLCLALKHEARGDDARAALLRARARRAQPVKEEE